MKLKKDKATAILLTACYILQLVPILYLGRYNHPTSDDFLYGKAAHDALLQTGSLLQAILAAAKGVAYDYVTWQGSYMALFFMRLQPQVFGEACYAIVPWLMIGLLTLGTLYFMRTITKVVLGSDSPHFISISMVILMICVQFAPVASEQFFWFNSSVYYNAFHSLMLLYLSWMLRYALTGKKRYLVYMAVMGAVIGGGNYITCLTLFMLGFLMIVYLLWKKLWVRAAVVTGLGLEFMIGFAVSAMAPGNAVRAQTTGGYGAVESMIRSLIQGWNCYYAWTDKWWLLGAVFMLPMMLYFIRRTSFRFPYPLAVLFVSYGVFCAMFCPTYFALGSTGPGRIINIIYDSFLVITYGQVFYGLGWCVKRSDGLYSEVFAPASEIPKAEIPKGEIPKGEIPKGEIPEGAVLLSRNEAQETGDEMIRGRYAREDAVAAKAGVLILLVLIFSVVFSEHIFETTTCYAWKTWRKGEAAQYDLEYRQRLAVLEDDSVKDCVFAPYSVHPDLVFIADGIDDPTFVNNYEWGDFYNKDSLTIRKE